MLLCYYLRYLRDKRFDQSFTFCLSVELVLLSCLRKRYAFFTKEIEKGKLACKIQTTCRCHELVIAILGRQDPYPLQQHVDICNPSDMYHVFFSTIFCVQLVLGGSLLVTR